MLVPQVRYQHHGNVERAVNQPALDRLARQLHQLQRDTGIGAHEARVVAGQKIARDGIGHADPHLAGQRRVLLERDAHGRVDG